MKKAFKQLVNVVADLFIPTPCLICEGLLSYGRSPWCERCANRLTRLNSDDLEQARVRTKLDGLYVPFQFDELISRLIHDGKYRERPDIFCRVGEWLAENFSAPQLDDDASFVPIPLHPTRLAERGFNQSALIARIVARQKNRKYFPLLLQRLSPTLSQTNLTRDQREKNVMGVFSVVAGVSHGDIRSVVLVDDIITTGSTIGQAAHVLRNNGVETVVALAIAQA